MEELPPMVLPQVDVHIKDQTSARHPASTHHTVQIAEPYSMHHLDTRLWGQIYQGWNSDA